MLQLLPRSSTGERMNPYTSLWTGTTDGDGPSEFHLVLLDGGRTDVLADPHGRDALHCIRCSACLNVCPVYERTGGHAYDSVYPGPIGAILTPQLAGLREGRTLPWASSLCGACYEVCPVKIDIPSMLVHLRGRIVRDAAEHGGLRGRLSGERLAMEGLARVFGEPPALRGRPEGRPGRAVAARARRRAHRARAGPAARVDRVPRPARRARGGVPRLVANPIVMTAAREDVLGRIRTALGPEPRVIEIPRDYVVASSLRARRAGRALRRARRGVPRDRLALLRGRRRRSRRRRAARPRRPAPRRAVRPARGLAAGGHRMARRRPWPRRRGAGRRPTASSRAARWRSRTPARSCSTRGSARAAAR